MRNTKLLVVAILFGISFISCKKNKDSDPQPEVEVVYISSDEFTNACSLNIRYSSGNDDVNNWKCRKQWVADFIYFFDLDIIGLQEEKHDQTADLRSLLSPDYSMIGRASSSQPGYEYNGIYYKTSRIERLDEGRFWLSETPDVESVGWDSKYHRQVTWGKFKHKVTHTEFFVFNTHFSHVSETARQNSATLLKNRIRSIADGAAVIVTGDFNTWPNTQPYNILTQDQDAGKKLTETRILAARPYNANYTGHCFGQCYEDGKIVDYVFVNDKVDVEKYGIITEQRRNVFLSDHYPVFTRLSFK